MAAARLDARAGAIASTGRSLDVAVEGKGFFVVSTNGGDRYTPGHFNLNADRQLITEDGSVMQEQGGQPITLGAGEVRIDQDGSIWAGTSPNPASFVVQFDKPSALTQESASRLRADGQAPTDVDTPVVQAGSLEQSGDLGLRSPCGTHNGLAWLRSPAEGHLFDDERLSTAAPSIHSDVGNPRAGGEPPEDLMK